MIWAGWVSSLRIILAECFLVIYDWDCLVYKTSKNVSGLLKCIVNVMGDGKNVGPSYLRYSSISSSNLCLSNEFLRGITFSFSVCIAVFSQK